VEVFGANSNRMSNLSFFASLPNSHKRGVWTVAAGKKGSQRFLDGKS